MGKDGLTWTCAPLNAKIEKCMNDSILIRPGTREDMPRVWELVCELAEFEQAREQVETSPEQFECDGFGESPLFGLLVAQSGEEIVGMALTYFRYSEEELASRRLKWGASVFLSLVGMAVWSGLFGYLNSALDFRPPQNQSFRVESNSGGQTRGGGFRRLVLRRGTKQILLQSGGPRWDKVREGQTISLPVGRGALGVAWLDAR